ncbi:ATP-dependent 3'-5' DNA helicase [Scheffersomyces spartinae]|uniref:DNA 3'-5' helicase n=1 Tax=Scheffersomyces spartinae TaxID=45513 RepID=A0A9P8AGZ3_9ASCO|nr:ATP-dependent 3'-5' DNA helicase [Scheffersomyces spartinae]KAG7191951.1 ATP-dependent 3'-5' DNA helicase [Scheffersomyces spartinae]
MATDHPSCIDAQPQPTDSQLAVIHAPMGANSAVAIHAGPGSGKTFVVVRRVIHWIESGLLEPEQVLVLSMTNKAVNLLRRRISEALGSETAAKEYGKEVFSCYTQPVVVDDISWKSFADLFLGPTSAFKGKKLRPRKLEEMINSIRMEELSLKDASEKYGVGEDVVRYMLNYLSQNGMMRYNDFISEGLRLLQASLDTGKKIERVSRYKAVVVDEFQDMLPSLLQVIYKVVQYPTANESLDKFKHLTVAGDPNQCIYEFLGADPGSLFNLSMILHPSYTITEKTITESFRLTPEILSMASFVCLKPFKQQYNEQLQITSVQRPLLAPILCPSASTNFIGEEIARLICQLGGLLRPGDFAILTRTNKGTEEVASNLKLIGFKYNVISSQQPWVTTNLHILIDILSVINQGAGSDFSLMCILLTLDGHTRPHSRLSRLIKKYNLWQESKGTVGANELEYYIKSMPEFKALYKSHDQLKLFLREVEKTRHLFQTDETPLQVLLSLYDIIECLGLKSHILEDLTFLVTKDDNEKPYEVIKENLNLFYQALSNYYYNGYLRMKSSERCSKFPNFISYFLRANTDPEVHFTEDKINISTVHSAKGLEFPIVFIVDDERQFQGSSWLQLLKSTVPGRNYSGTNLSQEARVLYVAITRARLLVYYKALEQVEHKALL